MTLEEAIRRCEEVADKKMELSKTAELQGCGRTAKLWWESAEEHRQLESWLRELKDRRVKQEYMAKDEATRYVFDELLKCSAFRGIYDAENGNTSFMYGVSSVMSFIACMVSVECYEKFIREFLENMIKSEEKAEGHEM